MYSDDDLLDDSNSTYYSSEYAPFLLLRGAEEASAFAHLQSKRREMRSGQAEVKDLESGKFLVAFHRVMRFFDTIEGFYTGSLDLTGRHFQRFSECQATWNSYVADFLALTVYAEEYEYEDLNWRGKPTRYTGYKFKNETAWKDFQRRWKVPSNLDFCFLLRHTQQVLRTMAQFPTSNIQKLCLNDLPYEILDIVFHHASMPQARLLATTCKLLCDIGQRHIFSHRSLSFDLKLEHLEALEKAEDLNGCVMQLAESARAEVLSVTSFLLERPDLTDKLRHLSIYDRWRFQDYVKSRYFELDDNFYRPLYKGMRDVLERSCNITSLRIYGLVLGLNFIRGVAAVRHLHTLDVVQCCFDVRIFSTIEWTQPGTTLHNSVYNLRLSFLSDGDTSLWCLLTFCPNLRTLSARRSGGELEVPRHHLWQRFSFFTTLERLSMTDLLSHELPDLAEWLHFAQDKGRLTHFKLHTHEGIPDEDAVLLIRALQPAPLQVLVLEGLAQAEFRLFDEISECLPGLLGLTVIRRASTRQLRNRSCSWPHAASEYARHVQGLTQLQHFGWNFDECGPFPSTTVLIQFEDGYPEESNHEVWMEMWTHMCENESFGDLSRLSAVLFATHCPSLRTYASTEPVVFRHWSVLRAPNGRVTTQANDRLLLFHDSGWNTPGFEPHWPAILPMKTDDQEVIGHRSD